MTLYAAVRCKRLNRAGIGRAEAHARRANKRTAKRRRRPGVEPDAAPSIGWAACQASHLEIGAAYDYHVKDADARPWGGGACTLHLLLITSPDWVAGGGDPWSPRNPRVESLLREAQVWADRTLGGCYAVRYDVDERSAGIVDVFVAPIRRTRGRYYVLPNRALNELQRKLGQRTTYAALQDSWAAHCREHLDAAFRRGRPKGETGAEHVHQDVIAQAHAQRDRERREKRAALKRASRAEKRLGWAQRLLARAYAWLPPHARAKLRNTALAALGTDLEAAAPARRPAPEPEPDPGGFL